MSDNAIESVLGRAQQLSRVVSKWRWLAVGVAAVAFALMAAGSYLVRDRYEASARVYVDTQTVLKPLMAGLTYQPDIDQQVRMLARTLLSRENLEKLLSTPQLRADVDGAAEPASREALMRRLAQDIKIQPVVGGNLYNISYRGPSPDASQHMVEATVNLFVNAGEGEKKRDSEEAGRFIEAQIRENEGKLLDAENRLKDFKIRNFGVAGVSNQDYFARTSVLSDEVSKLRVELSSAERAREAYRRELATEQPLLPIEKSLRSTSPAVTEVETRLEAQKKALDDLTQRYTDGHPDVVSARRVIAEIQRELGERRREEQEQLRALGRTPVAATSPIYQKLRVSLAEAEASVAALRSQVAAKQAHLDKLRAAAGRQPQIEAELSQLNRDYDIIRKNYEALVARRESASLGVRLDESSQLAAFRVIEPARASTWPVFPSRIHASMAAVVVSLVLGALAALLADALRPTVDDVSALKSLSRRAVIGSVSMSSLGAGASDGRPPRRVVAWLWLGMLTIAQAAWLMWIFVKSREGLGG